MAVIKAKPKKVVEFYLGLLEQNSITSKLVTVANGNDFKGSFGDTVTLRIKGLRAVARDYEFRTRTAPIQFDDIEGEDGIDVKLDTHITSGTLLTDEHYTLDDLDFAEEVVGPMLDAIVNRVEGKVVAGLRLANTKQDISFGDGEDPHLIALEAKRLMDSWKVAPNTGRTFLVGSNIAAQFLASDRLSKFESTGLAGTPALRDAIIGKLANSAVVEVPELDPDEGFYIHKTGLVLGNVAPDVPRGAATGAKLSKNGLAARFIQDYDPNYARDRVLVNTFMGLNDVRDERDANGDLVEDTVPGTTRKNVRIIKLAYTGAGSVLPVVPGS